MGRGKETVFPSHEIQNRWGGGVHGDLVYFGGLTVREYMAVHSTQPGMSEICAIAGVKWKNNRVWMNHETGVCFDDWWESMPLIERLRLAAAVRVAQADALLAELEK